MVNVYCAKCGMRHTKTVEECMCGSRGFQLYMPEHEQIATRIFEPEPAEDFAASRAEGMEPAEAKALKHPDGTPVKAGDMVPNTVYTIDATGTMNTAAPYTHEFEDHEDPDMQAEINGLHADYEAKVDEIRRASEGRADDDPIMPKLMSALALAHLRHELRVETTLWGAEYRKSLSVNEHADILLTIARDYIHAALAIKAGGGSAPTHLAAVYSEFTHHTARYFLSKGIIAIAAPPRPNPTLLDAQGNPIRGRKPH